MQGWRKKESIHTQKEHKNQTSPLISLLSWQEPQFSHGFNNKLQADQPELNKGLYISNYSPSESICTDSIQHLPPHPRTRNKMEKQWKWQDLRKVRGTLHITAAWWSLANSDKPVKPSGKVLSPLLSCSPDGCPSPISPFLQNLHMQKVLFTVSPFSVSREGTFKDIWKATGYRILLAFKDCPF